MVSEKASVIHKVVILGWMVMLGVFGLIKFILGCLYVNDCADMALLPWYLVMAGVVSLVPPLLTVYRNMYREESSRHAVDGLWWILEKVFFLSLVLIVAGTIYVLVSVAQARVIGRLCSQPWLPPFGLATLCVDWVCYIAFFCTICNVDYKEPQEKSGPMLPLYWQHRHRHRPGRY